MSSFVFNPFRAGEELTPNQLRKPIMSAWLRVLLRPVKYFTDRFLNNYCVGVAYSDYNSGTAYVKGNRVVWQDAGVYELRVATSTGIDPTGDTLSSTNWLKILDNFIGIDERVRYNGQLIVFEYAINRWFKVTAPPYIYFGQITVGASSVTCDVYVPLALYNSLGPDAFSRYSRVAEFVTKYKLAGHAIAVIPY